MIVQQSVQPVLIELDEQTWGQQIDRFAYWLGNVQMLQAAFRKYTEDAIPEIVEPNIRTALTEMAVLAEEHERKIDGLYEAIGRAPSPFRPAAGEWMAKAGEAMASLQALQGGAVGSWKHIHQLLLINVNALGAFAIAEQLGLALGLKEIIDITFRIIHEKQAHQLILQEYMLETAPISILYRLSL